MHPSLDKKIILRAMRTAGIILAVCLLVWLWGNNRRVNVELEFMLELKDNTQAQSIDLAFYQDQKVSQEMMLSVAPQMSKSNGHAALRPGKYELRGMVRTTDGKNHIVEQTIYVPNDDAQITVYLRD